MEDPKREHMEAYRAWQKQLQALHSVLLERKRMEAPELKGLLNREARAIPYLHLSPHVLLIRLVVRLCGPLP